MSGFSRPKAATCREPLADAVFFYIGDELDWDVELAIPAGAVAPVRLGTADGSAGPAGFRRTGRQPTNTGATRAFI